MTIQAEKRVIIFGAGMFAEVVRYYLEQDAGLDVVAHTVDGSHLKQTMLSGLPVVPVEEVVRTHAPESHSMLVAIGPHRVNRTRAEKCALVAQLGYRMMSYISSQAHVYPDLKYGPNTIVVEGSSIGPFVNLGHDVFVLGARIHHHCKIGDHCLIAESTLAGGVRVGPYSFLGLNAAVREQVTIGARNVIGAGAVIMKSTGDDEVYRVQGTPVSSVTSDRLSVLEESVERWAQD